MRLDNVPLKRIKKALQDDGVWVSPQLRSEISKADETRIEKAVDAAKPKQIYVALVDVPYDDPMYHGDVGAMFTIINDDTGMSGTFVGMESYDEPAVTVEAIGADSTNASYAGLAARARHPDDFADQVVDAVTLIGKGNALEVYNETEKPPPPAESQTSETGGPNVLVIVLVAAVVIAVVGLALYVRGRRRRSAEAGFQLPVNVLTTVREAERRRLLKRAKHDLLRLGERIDAAPMDGAAESWQAALDHYEGARSILDRSSQPADVVGVIVLTERGSQALEAAVAGDDWKPATPCYFNPLHGAAARTVRWGDEQAGVDVPACTACVEAVNAGRTPDALDFLHDGVPQHYFMLDLEPWSSTGYGALDADLLARLGQQ